MSPDQKFMQRCFEIALLGKGRTSPNPTVGAVLVYKNQIIGEGFHEQYGTAHAEVNAVKSVPSHLRKLIPEATLYVSLEPCCVYGKTPPCTNLILENKIKKVVVAT
ncbi:MAG: bifunctional diaminohydroxyphosphoribosylaminopyrimidine deaminase/5-amino-6-(5-phosphoribosylamino)uracil reductase RibD [Saprospiraceae bacterium]